MNRCEAFKSAIQDLVDDRLEAGEERRVRKHLMTCEACADYHRQILSTVDWIRSVPDERAPDLVLRGVIERLGQSPGGMKEPEPEAVLSNRSLWNRRLLMLMPPLLAAASLLFFLQVWSPWRHDEGETLRLDSVSDVSESLSEDADTSIGPTPWVALNEEKAVKREAGGDSDQTWGKRDGLGGLDFESGSPLEGSLKEESTPLESTRREGAFPRTLSAPNAESRSEATRSKEARATELVSLDESIVEMQEKSFSLLEVERLRSMTRGIFDDLDDLTMGPDGSQVISLDLSFLGSESQLLSVRDQAVGEFEKRVELTGASRLPHVGWVKSALESFREERVRSRGRARADRGDSHEAVLFWERPESVLLPPPPTSQDVGVDKSVEHPGAIRSMDLEFPSSEALAVFLGDLTEWSRRQEREASNEVAGLTQPMKEHSRRGLVPSHKAESALVGGRAQSDRIDKAREAIESDSESTDVSEVLEDSTDQSIIVRFRWRSSADLKK